MVGKMTTSAYFAISDTYNSWTWSGLWLSVYSNGPPIEIEQRYVSTVTSSLLQLLQTF